MKNLSYSIYFILFNLILIGQDYLWPTNASNTITAFFAEQRPRRYHAGIDIRTYGKTGFEVYAIEKGYVEKIKIDYKGYGKTLYLRLKDGNLAVYAHIDKFSPEIEDILSVVKENYNSQVFEHNFEKQEIIVKKGEIIAYTGDTGTISGPHLHFEIRDKNNISLNPLINFYDLEDDIAPIPYKIAVIPKTKETMIDGFSDIMLYNIYKNDYSEYYISDTISVIGKFGIALNALDKVNKQPFSYGLYNLELYIDGDLKYKVEYNEHDFSDGHLVLEERNYHLKRIYDEDFYNLYNSTPNLSFIEKESLPYYELEYGIHNIVIKAKDVNDNKIVIFGTIIAYPNEGIVHTINETNDSIFFNIDKDNTHYNYKIDICNKYNGKKINSIVTNHQKIAIDKTLLGDPFNIIHFSAKNRDGLNTKKYYYKSKFKELKSITGDFKIKGFTHGALIQFEENTFSNKTAKINILKKDTTLSYDTQRISQNILTTKIINYSDFSDASEIEIIYNTNPKINIKKRFYSAVFYPDQSLYLTKDNFIVNTITNFSNDSTLIWISDSNIEKPKKSKLLSGPYSISPQTLVFKNKLNIGFEYEDLDVGVGIYYYNNKKNNWSYLKTNYNNGMYSTSILSNEVFCLLKEKNPPEIKNLIPDINATYRAQDIEELTFEVEDDLSGISQIENISVKIDSLAVLFEYNPYRKKVFYKFEEELEKGPHLLEIKAKDNVGNVTSINGNFIIK